MSTVTVEQDTVIDYGQTTSDWADEVRKAYNVTATVKQEVGPAGGLPVMEYTGTKQDVNKLLTEAFGFEPDELVP